MLVTDIGYGKRCLLIDYDRQARAGKGVKTFTFAKGGANGERLAAAALVQEPYDFAILQASGTQTKYNTEDVAIESRNSKGAPYAVVTMGDVVEEIVRL